jgi:16S rRNA C1402 (ribose-2'-O) methylase RsmI
MSDFLAEDYRHTADLLRHYTKMRDHSSVLAVCSNNLNIILAALDKAASQLEEAR